MDKLLPRFGLLLIELYHLMGKDVVCQLRLDRLDAVAVEVRLFGID